MEFLQIEMNKILKPVCCLRLRDIGDGLGKAMHELGKVDHVHTSTNLSLTILANTCLSIGDKLYDH